MIAFFLDFFEIAFIIIPLLAPVADKLGIDLIWFGVLICANMQTSFMHPPFGFALFYLRGIAPPSIKTSDIYWGAIPWVVLQVILVAILIFWPQLGDLLDRQAARASIRPRSRSRSQQPDMPPPLDLGPPQDQIDAHVATTRTPRSIAAPGRSSFRADRRIRCACALRIMKVS